MLEEHLADRGSCEQRPLDDQNAGDRTAHPVSYCFLPLSPAAARTLVIDGAGAHLMPGVSWRNLEQVCVNMTEQVLTHLLNVEQYVVAVSSHQA